jgi:hypothetical protein
MKHYILCDEYSNYSEIADEKGLKWALIDELRNDTFNNGEEDFDIVKSNFEVMKKLALNDYDFNYLKGQLESFGWYIMDLHQLQQDLSNYQAFKHGTGIPSGCIPKDCIYETLEMIDKDMK